MCHIFSIWLGPSGHSLLTYMYKRSLINLFFKGYHGMLPSTLAEELVINGDRPSSRLKHGLIAPSFASKYVQNFPIEEVSSGTL